ncbi:PREDICTED: probable peroxygenase 5 [Ipomoea nil]|uniref:probable peroxygenase 5 n=1 Tax=Ipomoea nil TaxID=35883 RepID=UPI000900B5A0|nr:PREDICTED: probable peroxygenase 5 [Ipomoea nil]
MASSTSTKPYGKGMEKDDETTPLKKHVMFFDSNQDGIIYPWETFQGFRKIGGGFFLSVALSTFIHIVLSSKSRPGKLPSPVFPIVIENIKLDLHGSDSGAYDREGNFVESKIEEIFNKYGHTYTNALTSKEVDELLRDKRDPNDYMGWVLAAIEWRVLYLLAKDGKGLLTKERVIGVYDGSLFDQLAKEHAPKIKANNSTA